jgi:hypothetical protein
MKRIFASILVGVAPMVALAQTYAPGTGINGLITFFGNLLNRGVPFIISLAVVYFIWEVFQYAIAGDEEKKAKAKTGMIWGIVGIFVMVSIWGLVAILQSTFGTSGGAQNVYQQTLPI